MSIHVALRHTTKYSFDRPVSLAPHVVRLRPAPHCRTPVLAYSLKVLPAKHFINWQQDPQSNHLARLVFPEKTTSLKVEVELVAEMSVYNPFDFFLEPEAERLPLRYDPDLAQELAPFHVRLPATPRFSSLLERLRKGLMSPDGGEGARTINFLVGVNQLLNREIRYVIRLEPGVQTPEETLTLGTGSCRDSAWLLCQLLRHLGFAARFASGYLIQLKPDVAALEGPVGAARDFTDLHAWCEVYLPGAGWIGFDPTSGLLAGEGHLPLACTPEPSSAAPVSGRVDRCESKLEHTMTVTRIHEAPRVTKPYSEEQWRGLCAVAAQVENDLQAGDIRLTMGGEPTFVSLEDPDGEEWNTGANSVRKRELAGDLLRRLRDRFAPGGLLHFGTGKWYPGEQLPRWALACYWRRDGQPVWRDLSLVASEKENPGHTHRDARAFIERLTRALEIDPARILSAYEDAWYHLWRERRLPANVDPLRSNLADPLERERLAKVFRQGLDRMVGFALPLKRDGDRWLSGPWFLREEHLYLIPGDSPMGLRLPLDSLPWTSSPADWAVVPPDPLAPGTSLPAASGLRRTQGGRAIYPPTAGNADTVPRAQSLPGRDPSRPPQAGRPAPWIIRTALCVEPRNGRLHVFMPPLETAAAYLELVALVEDTAAGLGLPVIVEGEPPPYDAALRHFKVTPDPGVIEVNLHPAASWEELESNTAILYEEAAKCRLGAEKFMLDGRHTGTGGGNHVVMGGATPADSPFLRRPDLLRSLLGYWHNHPSLSYLFSGLFIGPTSQHPRVDEARNDALYELELAFRQVPDADRKVEPWIVDRIFRHLLVDVTGNTHRAEFSIDKMYSPDSSTGRLGLVELRSFEMPPHPRMSLAQQLLLRAAIARFWKRPYRPASLARWGTTLHDRFLLPHFVWQDFEDVLEDFRREGYPLDPAWFLPHHEFRFPQVGGMSARGIDLELRTALEPWHVLGEEPAGGGTVRYVDSSLERLQVKVRGMTDTRHVVTCNGRRVPLHPTGVEGEQVAGVRYRAWQPPGCLHPLIPVDTPLVFDLVDTWNGRSMGGCTYHVAHPGGRNHTALPVNAYEAESRRRARFQSSGHTQGPTTTPAAEPNREFPLTLDLRF